MPDVTVWPTPNGLPIASTTSPTCRWSTSPNAMTGSLSRSILSTARSDSGSVPTIVARPIAAVAERHLDVVGALDDVIVGQQVADGRDDHARAEPDLALLGRLARTAAEKQAETRVVRPSRGTARGDADDRGGRALCGLGIARRRRPGADQRDAAHRRRQLHRGGGCRCRCRRGDDDRLRLALQPAGLERCDDEQQRDCDRHRLREQEPGLAHRRKQSALALSWRAALHNGAWLCLHRAARLP